jgi:uncharacterized protein YacL
MLDRIIKYLFALIGAFTGVSLVRFFVKSVDFEALGTVQIALYVLAGIITAMVFFIFGSNLVQLIDNLYSQAEKILHKMTIYEVSITALGLIAGLIIANLISIPIYRITVSSSLSIRIEDMHLYLTIKFRFIQVKMNIL